MNIASLHLVIRNDNHCPTCRLWYLTTGTDVTKLQSGIVTWEDEWVRRRNGDKYQTINIIPDIKYDLSEWKLKTNSEINVNVSCLLLQINIDKNEWCPDNIKFYISFHENNEGVYTKAKEKLEDEELENLKNGYWKQNSYDEHKGKFFIIIELESDKEICLNDLCSQIQPENF